MDYRNLCNNIFDINKDIRFVAFINKSGKLIEGMMREGLESIDDEIHQKRWFNQVAMRAQMYEMFNKIYGKTHMVYVEREKLKQLTFYRSDNILYVTLQPSVTGNRAIEIAYSIENVLDTKK
ncbi:MAG: hypothetical protein ACE5KA_00495 [Nitrososphaerales archaeon]